MREGLTERQLIRCTTPSASPFLSKIVSRSLSLIFTKNMDGLFSKFASRDVLALSEGVSISVMMWSLWGDWMSLPFLRSMGTRWWAVLFLFILRYLSASSIFITLPCLRSNLPIGVRQSPAGCTLAFLGDPRWLLLKGRAGVAAVCVSLTSMGTQSESIFLFGSPGLLARRS